MTDSQKPFKFNDERTSVFRDESFYRFSDEEVSAFDNLPNNVPLSVFFTKENFLHLVFSMNSNKYSTFAIASAVAYLADNKIDEAMDLLREAVSHANIADNNFRRFYEGVVKSATPVELPNE